MATLAEILHEEMNFRVGIPDWHPEKTAVDEPTCQLLAAHLVAAGVTVGLDVDLMSLAFAVTFGSDAPDGYIERLVREYEKAGSE